MTKERLLSSQGSYEFVTSSNGILHSGVLVEVVDDVVTFKNCLMIGGGRGVLQSFSLW